MKPFADLLYEEDKAVDFDLLALNLAPNQVACIVTATGDKYLLADINAVGGVCSCCKAIFGKVCYVVESLL